MSTILSKKGDFSKIVLSLASPEYYLNLSCGEVVIPETINYKTSRVYFVKEYLDLHVITCVFVRSIKVKDIGV